MTRNELSLAVALAQSDDELETFVGEGSSQRLIDTFNCFGMANFQAVHITIRDLAALVRHECMQMNGELCNRAMAEIAELGKSKFHIVGLGDDSICPMVLPHWYAAMI